MAIAWDQTSLFQFTDLQFKRGGLDGLKNESLLMMNMTVQGNRVGCSVRTLDMVFPGMKRHFRFQETCHWTYQLTTPFRSECRGDGTLLSSLVFRVTAMVGGKPAVDMEVTVDYTLKPYLEDQSIRLRTLDYQLKDYRLLPSSLVKCQGSESKEEKTVYCEEAYKSEQTRLWQTILISYASQMKEYLDSRVIGIQGLLTNRYFAFDSQVQLLVRQGALLLQGPLARISLHILFDDLIV